MITINNIIKEINEVPVGRLEELYQLVHSMTPKSQQSDDNQKKILSFGGAFNDMNDKDYNAYLKQTKKTRNNLFDREIDL